MLFQNLLPFWSQIRNICGKHEKLISSLSALKSKILVGCGNPLLDISANVKEDFLQKYDLKMNTAIMAEERHKLLYKDLVENYTVEYTPGGSVQNSLRACQWILQKPNCTVFFGCIGNDEYANILQKRACKDGVFVRYQIDAAAPTGTCAVLINGTSRTLVASLGAAEHFNITHLNEEKNWCILKGAKYFYASGFFLVVSLESVIKVAQCAAECNNCFAFNLSAEFVSQMFMSRLKATLPYVDILFGNGQEADAFAIQEGWNTTDRKEIGRRLQCWDKVNCERPRIVIITQNHLPVLLIQKDSVEEFYVPSLAKEQIVDTNGAGDAFAGAFLAQYMLEKPLEQCVCCGIYAAQHITGQSGFRFKGKPKFSE